MDCNVFKRFQIKKNPVGQIKVPIFEFSGVLCILLGSPDNASLKTFKRLICELKKSLAKYIISKESEESKSKKET
jgi:hypothetical protein